MVDLCVSIDLSILHHNLDRYGEIQGLHFHRPEVQIYPCDYMC
jgi:hypothetical protein